ncbi:TPA: hypothetical protein DDW35_07435, partial [Candidatus Sumerlaeota bacterium]|nr:hypothetical protein [Candidatus Sumerlaeota bacterium]
AKRLAAASAALREKAAPPPPAAPVKSSEDAGCGCEKPTIPKPLPVPVLEDADEVDPCDHHTFEGEEAGPVTEGEGEPAAPCACKGLLKYRRAHCLCGAIFGTFVVGHLLVIATGISPAAYTQNCQALDVLVKNFRIFEIVLVLLPLTILLLSGLYLLGRSGLAYHIKRCKRGGKMRHFLQRWSAVCLLAFLLFHTATFSVWGLHTICKTTGVQGLERYEAGSLYHSVQPYESTLAGVRHFWAAIPDLHPMNVLVMAFYLLGTLAFAYHLPNGLWTGTVAWEFCKVSEARRYLTWPCLAIGVIMATVGFVAWAAFTILPH